MVRRALKGLARLVCGDYAAYYIYCQTQPPRSPRADLDVTPIDGAALTGLTDPYLAAQAEYAGEGSTAFCLRLDGVPAAVCFYWSGQRYAQHSGHFWPLASGQAKLMQIVTTPQARGCGVATRLIAESASRMSDAGWQLLYARVWHSHSASWRAFERAGWKRVALVLELNPLRRETPWRLRLALRRRP